MLGCEFRDLEGIRDLVESGFDGRSVLVVGDIMLDIHVWGAVSRISPEAPVPVVRRLRQTLVAGGAANVAMNLAGLGLSVRLAGLVGDDTDAGHTVAELERAGIGVQGVLRDAGRPTTTKMRVIGGHQQILRLDQESVDPPLREVEDALLDHIDLGLNGCSAVILSDYAKGVLTPRLCREVVGRARRAGIPVLVDPKGSHWEKYRGAHRITPNRSELVLATGLPLLDRTEVARAAGELARNLELDGLVVTLSEEGMLLVAGTEAIHVPAMAREVFDVSGAGDTAIATIAAAMAAGIDGQDALLLANIAAGIVVGKVGTVPLTRGELLVTLDGLMHPAAPSKFLPLEAAKSLVRAWKARGEKIVFTNGCFDILHAGHVSYLGKARRTGDRLILGLNSDDSVRRLKGPTRPINDQEHRATVLAGLEAVDAIVVFEQDTPLELILELQPDILAKGADYREEDVVGAREVRSWGGDVRLVELVQGVSTTGIARKISEGR